MHGLQFVPPQAFQRIRFVLVQPSHPGNVGATARAMSTMGLERLVLVEPRFPDVLEHPDALAFASGAGEILAGARRLSSLEEALEGVSLAVAVSAASREFGPMPEPPGVVAQRALAELSAHPDHELALVFGPERTGLSIEAVQRCQALVSIPTAPGHESLNLAQSVQVMAYTLACAAHQDLPALQSVPWAGRLANHEALEGLFAHLERSMVAIGFIDPRHPKKLMPRLRRLLSRARLEVEEVDILRGICTQIDKQVQAASREKP
jgi:tRNA/rRNA methyltransferase